MLISQHYRKKIALIVFIFLNIVLNSFEEAFSLLIREIETIKRDNLSKNNNTNDRPTQRPHSTGSATIDKVQNMIGMFSNKQIFCFTIIYFFLLIKESKPNKSSEYESTNKITDWDTNAVKKWLERVGLSK